MALDVVRKSQSSSATIRVSATTALRTLALVGPAAAGKTSLAEALLVKAGMIGAAGTAALRLFDPETAHVLSVKLMAAGLAPPISMSLKPVVMEVVAGRGSCGGGTAIEVSASFRNMKL